MNTFFSISAIIISLFTFFWNVHVERKKSKSNLQVIMRRHYFMNIGNSDKDERPEIELICRNRSSRQTVIIDIWLRNNETIIGGTGYKNRIELPIKLEPWGIAVKKFRIEKSDWDQLRDILVMDMDDNEYRIEKFDSNWVKSKKYTSKK